MSRRPNIVLIISDQERSHRHWPKGWAEENLSTYYDILIGCQDRKDRSSVVFPNAFTATTECSPSRASLLTSSYPTEHGVKTTPGNLDYRIDSQPENQHPRPNLLRLLSTPPNELQQKGYDVAWKGKWHLSPPSSSKRSSKQAAVLKLYGATSPWNPPDAGHSLYQASTLGGGRKYNNDGRYLRGTKHRFDSIPQFDKDRDDIVRESRDLVDPYISSDDDSDGSGTKSATQVEEEEEECIFDFLKKHTLTGTEQVTTQSTSSDESSQATPDPFFLIASLVNPHDVWASSCFSNLTDDEFYKQTGYHPREFETLPIELPPNHKDDLLTKPLIQMILNEDRTFGDLPDVVDKKDPHRTSSDALRYIRFYAYLHKLVDAEIGSLLDAVQATGQMDNTIIIRMADHGEQALSHGLREKRMQCYEETMNIPLVINYPTGWFDNNGEHGSTAPADSIDKSKQINSTRVVSTLVSSIDILPTIAEIVGVDCSSYQYRGKSLVPFVRNGDANSNPADDIDCEEILFTFDEPLAPPGVPGYIRCIRTADYKYAVYFTIDGKIMEYEMYHLDTDPYEMTNLCGPNIDPDYRWFHFHDRLTQLMKKMRAVPTEFDWEMMSTPRRYGWA